MYIVVCYDIENNRQRNRISQTLLDAGLLRVQKSVFEGEITPKNILHLKKKLKKYVGKNDSIRYYSLCPECVDKTNVQGLDLTPSKEEPVKIV